jgi:CO/xanthine dehydrogenase FAD-binding subunit
MADMPEARVYAGGTDLLVQERNGRIPVRDLICLEQLPALTGIEEKKDEFFIGSATPFTRILDHPGIRRRLPILWEAISKLGSPLIRNMASIGGNICTASPAGDTLPPLFVLEAEVNLLSAKSSRRIPVSELITGPGQTDLKPGEILYGIHIPEPRTGSFQFYEKVGKRNALACSIVSLAAIWWMPDGDRLDSVRLAWGSVGPTVMRFPEVENLLSGRIPAKTLLKEAGEMVCRLVQPITDLRAGAEYRRRTAGNLVLRLAAPLTGEKGQVR